MANLISKIHCHLSCLRAESELDLQNIRLTAHKKADIQQEDWTCHKWFGGGKMDLKKDENH